MPTLHDTLRASQLRLEAQGIENPRLNVEFMLAKVLGRTVSELRLGADRPFPAAAVAELERYLVERESGKPLAYVLGEWEFYGLELAVDPRVLVPRPETELLVDWIRELVPRNATLRIADVGTGSGCVAIALAIHLPHCEIHATDVSTRALEVARANAARHGLDRRLALHHGDLMAPLPGRFDWIVSNPPYVAHDDSRLEPIVRTHEPALALFDCHDGDGLGFYRRFAAEFPSHLAPGGHLLFEVGENDASRVCQLFGSRGCTAESKRDLAGIERAVLIRGGG